MQLTLNVFVEIMAASYCPGALIDMLYDVSFTVTVAVLAPSEVSAMVIVPLPLSERRFRVYSLLSPVPNVLLSYKLRPP